MIFLWAGIEFTQFAFNRTSELAELPLWLIHVAWPATGATWMLFVGERMADDIDILRGRKAAAATGQAT
jgi:TRAP-type C4-dicarboxylate transport system permease small subunit